MWYDDKSWERRERAMFGMGDEYANVQTPPSPTPKPAPGPIVVGGYKYKYEPSKWVQPGFIGVRQMTARAMTPTGLSPFPLPFSPLRPRREYVTLERRPGRIKHGEEGELFEGELQARARREDLPVLMKHFAEYWDTARQQGTRKDLTKLFNAVSETGVDPLTGSGVGKSFRDQFGISLEQALDVFPPWGQKSYPTGEMPGWVKGVIEDIDEEIARDAAEGRDVDYLQRERKEWYLLRRKQQQ